jgi:hypothetical protein
MSDQKDFRKTGAGRVKYDALMLCLLAETLI